MQRFIKYHPDSEMAKYLQTKPIANHLANVIATRARRTDCPFTGLKIGECLLGNYKKIGITEQQYRTAKKCLQRIGLAMFRGTNKGTVAKLVSIEVYDINVQAPNGQTNSNLTEQQRLTKNDKNKELKKSKETPLKFLVEMEQILKGEIVQRSALDKNFNFGLFPEEWSDNFKNEILGYFRYMEQKKTDRWGVLGTISSQFSVLKSYCQQFSEKEIIAALKETQLKGNTSYNPEWTKNRNKNKAPETPTTNFSLDSINTYQ